MLSDAVCLKNLLHKIYFRNIVELKYNVSPKMVFDSILPFKFQRNL
jgi:hypothetical protein